MGKTATGSVLHHLRGLAAAADVGLADSALLERFLTQRDEAAFGSLVRRHGPLVWGVCRRVLRDPHDAEDAFQATFLVLVRRAASIARRELLGNWLYGVAYRTARAARAAAGRRRAKEARAVPRPQSAEEDPWQELRPVLDEELSRLPDKYRVPVVLCDLGGTSRRQAARALGLAEGTLSSRLARARALLRRRLTRRGLGLTAGALAAGLGREAGAALPPGLVAATVKAGAVVPAGPAAGVVSARAVALSEGVIRAMFLTRLKVATVVLMIAALSGGAALLYRTQAAEQTEAPRGTARADEKQPADRKDEKPKTDQERLQGTWEFVSVSQGDKIIKKEDLGKEDAQSKTASFDGDKARFVNANTGGKEVEFDYRFKLDPSRKPKAIDLTALDDKAKGETTAGLYELSGDVLKLCFWDRPSRPTALDSKEVSRTYLITFKRVVK